MKVEKIERNQQLIASHLNKLVDFLEGDKDKDDSDTNEETD